MATTWDPAAYLAFAGHRERPFDELVARIPLDAPRRVIDLGCGPGTATARLALRWPDALVVGVDSSPQMIRDATTRSVAGRLRFEAGDARQWTPDGPVDVVVSNAMLQWVPGHEDLLRKLAGWLTPGGVLAFQVPANFDHPIHTELRRLVASGRWEIPSDGLLREAPVLEPSGYLELLLGLGVEADVWETTYLQVLMGPDAVLEWARGTALRPVLDALLSGDTASGDTEAFLAEYGAALRSAYPTDGAGRTVFPFRRIFAVARRPS